MTVLRTRARRGLASLLDARTRASSRRVGAALLYHAVGEPPGDPDRELVPRLGSARFLEQLELVRQRYDIVAAADLGDAIRSRRRAGRVPVAITFDDDLRSHLEVCAPILADLGAPATFFLTGNTLDGPRAAWWEQLQDAWRRPDALAPTLRRSGVDVPLDSGLHQVAAAVERLPASRRDALAEQLAELRDGPIEPGLQEQHVRALASRFDIGFHTRRHDALTTLDDAALQEALADGRRRLEEMVGRQLETIAYPHGAADARVADAARRHGFRAGFTTDAVAATDGTDVLLLGRLESRAATADDFGLQLARLLATPRAGTPAARPMTTS